MWRKGLRILIALLLPATAICNSKDSLNAIVSGGIEYLNLNQIKKDGGRDYRLGEWPTYLTNLSYIPFLGPKGKAAYDSNGFNTLFIHNTLAEIYLKRKDLKEILPVISLAKINFLTYKTGFTFNFWPELERTGNLQCAHKGCKQRGPAHFKYYPRFIRDYANICDDADDTAAGYLAMGLSDSIFNTGLIDSGGIYSEVRAIAGIFETYRDTGERKTNWYNKKTGFNYRTGAYLTWFSSDRRNNNFLKWFFPDHFRQNVTYGSNDVDCVVNANVLRCLSFFKAERNNAFFKSVDFVKTALVNGSCQTCGNYYPTEFSFHYSVAKAIRGGVAELESSREIIVQQILKGRNNAGYWSSAIEMNDLQSTLFALNTLLLLDDRSPLAITAIEDGMRFVLQEMKREGAVCYWNGGVFFSGGNAIRYEHVWKSDAFTTALALEALVNYLEIRNRS